VSNTYPKWGPKHPESSGISYFDFQRPKAKPSNTVDFTPTKSTIEHVDATSIVERIEWTDEMKVLFKDAGYEID
jgi:hypothetical protein